MKKDNSENIKISENVKDLVISRIEASPSDLRLSAGSGESMTKADMIKHVQLGDEIGRQIIKTHISFLRAIASGEVSKALASV